MGKKSPSPPAPPDPKETAEAQGAADVEIAVSEARLNNTNQYTPYGSLVYSEIGREDGVPRYQAVQTLSADEQAKLDLSNDAALSFGRTANDQLSQVASHLSRPVDFSGLGPAPTADFSNLPAIPVANEETRQNVRDSMLARLQPQQDQDQESLTARLAVQGIGIGTEAYNQEMDRYQRGVNDLRLAADAFGGDEMARIFDMASRSRGQQFGEAAQRYNVEANARDREINELIQQRTIPLNELSAMLTGSQVSRPQFVNTPQVGLPQTPLAESIYATYNGQLNAASQANAAANANTQGLFGLAGAGLGALGQSGAFSFSDRRLKRGIDKLGELANGLCVYEYHYIWGGPRQIGLMADEVRKVRPNAVVNIGGFDAVNYAEAVR